MTRLPNLKIGLTEVVCVKDSIHGKSKVEYNICTNIYIYIYSCDSQICSPKCVSLAHQPVMDSVSTVMVSELAQQT